MEFLSYIVAFLLVSIGIAHSYLGEKYILIRLFRRDNLPKLYGGTDFTKNTLRFAWHLTTLCWLGFAVIAIYLVQPEPDPSVIANVIGVTFILHGVVALLGSRAKHFAWPVFLVIGVCALISSNF